MRGIGSAAILALLEKYCELPIQRIADLITGTSTGSILAALAAVPNPAPAASWGRFYRDAGPRIFRKGIFSSARWVMQPKFCQVDLQRELKTAIGESWHLDEAVTNLMIPTIDANATDAVFLKSWRPENSTWRIWEAAAASASAQTFFPAFRRGPERYIDGGSHSNCPAACGLFEAFRLWPNEELCVVSIGTGRQSRPKPLPDGGLATWAPLLFGTCSETQDDVADYFCSHAPGVKYFRFDFAMDQFPAMDDASEKTLSGIEEAARHSVFQNWKGFQSCVDFLKEAKK